MGGITLYWDKCKILREYIYTPSFCIRISHRSPHIVHGEYRTEWNKSVQRTASFIFINLELNCGNQLPYVSLRKSQWLCTSGAVQMPLEFSSNCCFNIRKPNVLRTVGTSRWDRFGWLIVLLLIAVASVLRRTSEAPVVLGSRFRIPLRAWIIFSCVCFVLCR
jgi:hypothetical protein